MGGAGPLSRGRQALDRQQSRRATAPRHRSDQEDFLFLGSDTGGDRAAIIYTVAETAKLNGLDPEAYITAVLDRLARGHTIDRIDELLPWNFRLTDSLAGTG
ncbi:transposase domain-containing protein [Pseudoroseomonas cervicalis]|nr:transposase domain-containing protein [Pseudoroseomonas cervicalis]WBV43533.1 transposase domain-containing protein [Pseudoroseomonas cervicalis]